MVPDGKGEELVIVKLPLDAPETGNATAFDVAPSGFTTETEKTPGVAMRPPRTTAVSWVPLTKVVARLFTLQTTMEAG